MGGPDVSIKDADFGVQIGIGFLGRVVMALVAFAGSIVLARALGPAGYGAFYLLMAVVQFLDNPVTGWATACRKRLTETDFPPGEAVGSTILGVVTASAVVFAVAWLASPYITSYTGARDTWLYLGVLFATVVSFRASIEVLKATKRFGVSTWVEASRDTLRVAVQITLILSGFGVAGMVGGMALANFALAPVVLYLVGTAPAIPSRVALRDIWQFAKSSIPTGFVGTAQQRMDVILLGLLVGTEMVGNYEIALKMTIPAMFVAGVAQDGLMGRISDLRSRGESFVTDVQSNLAYASIVGVPLFFGAFVLARPVVVTIYSNQFAGAAPFLVGLALFRLLRTQKAILVSTINGLDRPDLNLKISTVVFAINLTLGVALLYVIGPIGVVVATVVSELLGYGIRGYIVRSLVPAVSLLPRPLLEQLLSGAVMGTLVYAGREMLPLATWPYVALLVGLGCVCYFAVLLTLSTPLRATVLAVAEDAGFR